MNSIDAGSCRIGTVVQELGLVDGLPVGLNIFLGRMERFSKKGVLDMKMLYTHAAEQFEKWNFKGFSMQAPTGSLSVEEKKIVELIRALSIEPDLLILDEITQALSLNYREILFDVIKLIKADGKAILLVTHDVEEMIAITDSITVMRDGKLVETCMSENVYPNDVKRLMVGREVEGSYYRDDKQDSYEDKVVLSVQKLECEFFKDVTFDLHKGEILGFCGLSDAGTHELAEALFAVRPTTKGKIVLPETGISIKSPLQAMRNKMGYVPKDRDKQALMVNDSIENNVSLPAVELIKGRVGFLNPRKRRELSKSVVQSFDVKTKGITQLLSGLSGGNRQKVNLGRWMIQDKDILILDCPTRGVDVGVKSYIYHSMLEAKKRGVSMIVVSDELPELIGMADTLMVMNEGKIKAVLNRSEGMTEETIIEVML